MTTSVIPPKACLDQLKNQAKDILKAHRRGDPSCCDVLRRLKHLKGKPDETVLEAEVKLCDVQFALANQHGHKSWPSLKSYVTMLEGARRWQEEYEDDVTECARCGDLPLIDVICQECGSYVVGDADNCVHRGDDGLVYYDHTEYDSVLECSCGSTDLRMEYQTYCSWCEHMVSKDD